MYTIHTHTNGTWFNIILIDFSLNDMCGLNPKLFCGFNRKYEMGMVLEAKFIFNLLFEYMKW